MEDYETTGRSFAPKSSYNGNSSDRFRSNYEGEDEFTGRSSEQRGRGGYGMRGLRGARSGFAPLSKDDDGDANRNGNDVEGQANGSSYRGYEDTGSGDFGDRMRGGGVGRGRGRGRGAAGGVGRDRERERERDRDEGGERPREFYIPPEPTDDENELFDRAISSGINFKKYDKIPVQVTGKDAPPSIQRFSDAGLRELVLTNIKKSHYEVPTPIQKACIPIIMGGRDLMACAQTGSGKTAAFLLPIINELLASNDHMSIGRPHALIISPTRELSSQIFDEARKFAMDSFIKVKIIYGGTSTKYQLENMQKGCHILICTVGRMMDFLRNGYISFEDTKYIVLDEADRMLDMGFRDDIATVMNHKTMRERSKRQVLMFSATFPKEIQKMAGDYLANYIFVTVGVVGGACTDVKQTIINVPRYSKRNKLIELLNESADGTIVFVETKRGADFLASLLSETTYPTTSIHGDRLQSQREMALRDFRTGRMKVLIATSVAARGLDIKNIQHVINYDMPKEIDEYVHRIGRTGRVGNDGKATSFFDPDVDSGIAKSLIRVLEEAGQEVPSFLLEIGGDVGNYDYDDGGAFASASGSKDIRDGVKSKCYNDAPSALEDDETWE